MANKEQSVRSAYLESKIRNSEIPLKTLTQPENDNQNLAVTDIPTSKKNTREQDIQTAEALLKELQKYIMHTDWHTGSGGERVALYTSPKSNHIILTENTVPHHVAKQLDAIEEYILSKHQATPAEQLKNAERAIIAAFDHIPQQAIEKHPGFSGFFKRILRYNDSQKYYSLFTGSKKDKLLATLNLKENKEAKTLLERLIPDFDEELKKDPGNKI